VGCEICGAFELDRRKPASVVRVDSWEGRDFSGQAAICDESHASRSEHEGK